MKTLFAIGACLGLLTSATLVPAGANDSKVKTTSMNTQPVSWIQDNKPLAIIVVADQAFPIARYAAEELNLHIKLATGVALPIVTESAAAKTASPKIYIGKTAAALRQKIELSKLAAESCVIKSIGNDFYIAGNDGPGDALEMENIHSGTLWGVYEILERELQALWLWPGAKGIVVPAKTALRVPPYSETIKPKLGSRVVRTYVPWNEGKPVIYYATRFGQESGLAYSSEAKLKEYLTDQQVFLRRHRLGMSQNPNYSVGHSFSEWWTEYGQKHPEWFQLIPAARGEFANLTQQERARVAYGRPQKSWEGKRGPDDAGVPSLVSMCVSNRELHKEIIRRWQEKRAKNPGLEIPVEVGENDIWALCICDECVKLDAPQRSAAQIKAMPGSVPGLHFPFDAGRRYAWFYNEIYKLAAKVDLKAKVTGYIYLNYFVAPTDITLNKNVILNFVPWGGFYYPRDPREQAWLEDQWMQWRRSGATLFYRPNYILDGGSMPINYATQMIDQMDFFFKNGCIGTDFDARVGQWSAQGATMYALLRKQKDTDKSAGQLLQEYYNAFGPASRFVKAYFDFWEAHTTVNSVLLPDVMERNRATNLLTYARAAQELYPQSAFDKAAEILKAAETSVTGDNVLTGRVRYLQLGLTHANKARNVSAIFADKSATIAEQRAALRDLALFRQSTEDLDVANYSQSAADELRSFSDRYDFKTKFDVTVMPADTPMK